MEPTIHVQPNGVIYEIRISPEEATQRVAELIRGLYRLYLQVERERMAGGGEDGSDDER